ncbi:MAG: hypothetical protein ACREQ9_14390 [Candidatus Binatia bacterium]
MPRILLAALAAVVLLVPATADGHSGVRLRGIVTAEDASRSFVTVSSARRDHVLRVMPATLDRIRIGMRVELRGAISVATATGPGCFRPASSSSAPSCR